ncbi:hypothetical protein [Kutzneria sp. NPDC052558]|uniref:hypothetical protein n=1 Tax=Kutzneria sp. NPDC052558 TaxID=3364121 RepID=UPI0037C87162
MRRIPALMGLLLLTACGAAHPGSSGPAQSASGGPVMSTKVGPPTLNAPPPLNQAVPDPSVVNLRAVRFDQTVANPDNKLVVQYTASGRPECAKLGRVDVVEADDAVTVTVRLGQAPGVDCSGPQPMIAATFQTIVTLKAPLGDRPVRDGGA